MYSGCTSKEDELVVGQQEIKKGQQDIQLDTKELLRRIEEPIYEKLMHRYPLGYAMLYYDGSTLTYKVGNNPLNIDWSTLKILELSDTRIKIKLPNISGVRFKDTTIDFDPRIKGAKGAVSQGGDPLNLPIKYQMVFEILNNGPDSIIGVAGACEQRDAFCMDMPGTTSPPP